MKKGTPEDAVIHILYANLKVILHVNTAGVLFVTTVPLYLTHFVELVIFTLTLPDALCSAHTGLKLVTLILAYTPPEDCALVHAYPSTVLMTTLPVVTVAELAVISLPRGTSK